MTDPAPDPLAAELTRIQESAGALTASHADEDCAGDDPCTGHDALRLVAAVKRVLALHRQAPSDDPAVTNHWCQECSFAWPCPTYAALAGELLSKEDEDG